MSLSPGQLSITLEQYALWREQYRYGQKSPLQYYPLTGGWIGSGAYRLNDGSSVPITVTIMPETIVGEGGTVDLEINAASLAPGCYPGDVWLKPPGEPAFKWVHLLLQCNESVSTPPP